MASLQSKCIKLVLRLTGMKHRVRHLARLIEEKGPERCPPPSRFCRRFMVETDSFQGFPVYEVRPTDGGSDTVIVYLHGGAYVNGFAKQHWDFIGTLVDNLNATVVAPDYPLAPKHDHQDVFAMLLPYYKKMVSDVGSDRIFFMGDSAGGGLSLALSQLLREQALPQPRGLVLLSPWLDVTMADPQLGQVDPLDPFLSIDGLKDAGCWYAGHADPQHYLISPLYGDLKGLPPIQIFTGTHDILVVDARRFHDKAQREGIQYDYREYEAMFHVWMLLPIAEAEQARRQIKEFVTRCFADSA